MTTDDIMNIRELWAVHEVRWRSADMGIHERLFSNKDDADVYEKNLTVFAVGAYKSGEKHVVQSYQTDLEDVMHAHRRRSFLWPWQAEAFAAGLSVGGAESISIEVRLPTTGVPKNLDSDVSSWWTKRPWWAASIFNQGLRLVASGMSCVGRMELDMDQNGMGALSNITSRLDGRVLSAMFSVSDIYDMQVSRHKVDEAFDDNGVEDDDLPENNLLELDDDFLFVEALHKKIFATPPADRTMRGPCGEGRVSNVDQVGRPFVHKIRWTMPDTGVLTIPASAALGRGEEPDFAEDDHHRETAQDANYRVFEDADLGERLLEGNQWCFTTSWQASACLGGLIIGGAVMAGFVDENAARLDAAATGPDDRDADRNFHMLARSAQCLMTGLHLAGAQGAQLEVFTNEIRVCKLPLRGFRDVEGLRTLGFSPERVGADLRFDCAGTLREAWLYEEALVLDVDVDTPDYVYDAVLPGTENWTFLEKLADDVARHLFAFEHKPRPAAAPAAAGTA